MPCTSARGNPAKKGTCEGTLSQRGRPCTDGIRVGWVEDVVGVRARCITILDSQMETHINDISMLDSNMETIIIFISMLDSKMETRY